MQIVIDIPENRYRLLKTQAKTNLGREKLDEFAEAVLNGTPLPKEHGRLIDADETLKRHCVELCREKPSCHEDCLIYDLFHLAPTIIEADIPTMYYPQVEGITPTVINNGSDMLSAEEIDNLLQYLAEGESEDRETCWDTISKEAEEYEADLDNYN